MLSAQKTPTQGADSTGISTTKKDNENIVIPSIALQAHALQSKVQCAIFEYVTAQYVNPTNWHLLLRR